MVGVEGGEVVAVAATEGGVFLEQALLDIEAECVDLVVGVALGQVAGREAVDLAVAEQHVVEALALQLGGLRQQFGGPDLVGGEALGEFHQLPEVGLRLARCLHQLVPELRAALGIAEGAFLLHPHGAGQDQVGGLGRDGGVDVGDDHEVVRVAPTGQHFLHHVGTGLHVVADLGPVDVEHAVLEHPALLHGVEADLLLDGAGRHLPDLLRGFPVLRVGHHQVGGEPVGEGADLARGAAGRGLAGEREGAVARFADLPGEQVDVVDQVVRPDPSGVLVEAHGPERHHLALGVGVEFGEGLQALGRHAAFACGALQGIGLDELGEGLEVDVAPGVGLVGVLRLLLQRVVRAQAVADVLGAMGEAHVALDEVAVHRAALDDVVGDVVEDDQVGLRLEHHGQVGQLEAAVLEGGQHRDLDLRRAEPAVGDPRPEHRMHLGHVRAPEDEAVGGLDIVVAAHRLVHAEAAHEAHHRRGHAVAGVGVDVVAAQAGLEQLVRRIAFPDRPLAGAEHADRLRSLGLERGLEFLGHDVEGLLPADRLELALLVELAVLHAQQRAGQAVAAVHDLRQEVALHAVDPAIDLGLDVAVGGHYLAVAGGDHHAATGAAEAAGCLVPGQAGDVRLGHQVAGADQDRQAGRRRGDGGGVGIGEFTTGEVHRLSPRASTVSRGRSWPPRRCYRRRAGSRGRPARR